MFRSLILLALVAILGGCSSANFADDALLHRHWLLSEIDGKTIPSTSEPPHLEIGEHLTINGIAGCNRFFGQGHLEDDWLWVTSMGNTETACAADLDQVEQAVLETLTDGGKLSGSIETLVLQGKQHQLTYRLKDRVY